MERRGEGFFSELWRFEYDPKSPESWVRAGCQMTVVLMMVTGIQALDGKTCGVIQFNVFQPVTWTSSAGCFIRGLVQTVPVGLGTGQSPTVTEQGEIVTPPAESVTPQ